MRSVLLIVVLALPLIGYPLAPVKTANASSGQNGNPATKVWLNTGSGVYHCPGSRWYGKTKNGEYVSQWDAQEKGYRPANGKVCEGAAPSSSEQVHVGQCGYDRWAVKTLVDRDARRVDFTPIDSTVAKLGAIRIHEISYPENARIEPEELHTFRVQAKLIKLRREKDMDLHLILADLNNPEARMIAEVPDPACAKGSGYEAQLRAARAALSSISEQAQVEVIGVGFFDYLHESRGGARNGFELHPVLRIKIRDR